MRLLSMLALFSYGYAGDRYVELTGSDAANTCENAGTPCATVDAAMSQAGPGDTIYVGAGTFSSTAVGYPMMLEGGVNLEGVSPAATRVVAGEDLLSVGDGAAVRIANITLDSLGTVSGETVEAFGDLALSLDNVTISGGRAGLSLSQSYHSASIDLVDCDVDGAQRAIEVTGYSGATLLTIEDSTLNNASTALRASFNSGGVHAVLLDGVTISSGTRGVDVFMPGSSSASGSFDLSMNATDFVMVSRPLQARVFGADTTILLDDVDMGSTVQPFNFAIEDFATGDVRIRGLEVADMSETSRIEGEFTEVDLSVIDTNMASSSGQGGIHIGAYTSGVYRVAMRDVTMTNVGTGVLGRAATSGSLNMIIDGLSVSGADRGVEIDVGTSGAADINLRDLDLRDVEVGILSEVSGVGVGLLEVRDAYIEPANQSTSRGVELYAYGSADHLLDGMTIRGGYTGLRATAASAVSTAQFAVELRRSEITGTEERAIYFGDCQSGVNCSLRVERSRIADNGNAGVQIGPVVPLTSISLENTVLMNNATLYGYGSAYNGYDIAAVSSSTAQINAHGNWWGTTDPAAIQSRIENYGPPIDISLPQSSQLDFIVAPPRGTPSGGELLLLRENGAPALVERNGVEFASVTVGGVDATVLWAASHGGSMRVRVPAMPPGTYDVVVTDVHGNTGTEFAAYTVQSANDTVSLEHQDFVRRRGTFLRVSDVAPNADLRLYLSPNAVGPAACPPHLQGGCLQIPEPYAVKRMAAAGSNGILWERIGPPNLAQEPDFVSVQVVEFLPGGGYNVSPVSVQEWQAGKGDADQDGLDNDGEHDRAANMYGHDADGDHCDDDVDVRVFRPSIDSDLSGLPDDCEW